MNKVRICLHRLQHPSHYEYSDEMMGLYIQQLHLVIAWHVQFYMHSSLDKSMCSLQKARLILPQHDTGADSKDLKGWSRYKIILGCRKIADDVAVITNPPPNSSTFAIMRFKNSTRPTAAPRGVRPLDPITMREAELVIQQAQCMFATQHDRCHIWSIMMCRTQAHIYLLCEGRVIGLYELDFKSPSGLCTYVQLVVDWSLCSWPQLGYNPSIRHLSEAGYWAINIPQISSDGSQYNTVTYYFNHAGSRMVPQLGQAIPCFVVSTRPPVDGRVWKNDASTTTRLIPVSTIKAFWKTAESNKCALLGESYANTHIQL